MGVAKPAGADEHFMMELDVDSDTATGQDASVNQNDIVGKPAH